MYLFQKSNLLKHENELSHIHVLKTNISSKKQINLLTLVLDKRHGIKNVSVALDDVDKVLRIESKEFSTKQIIKIVKSVGIMCDELKC